MFSRKVLCLFAVMMKNRVCSLVLIAILAAACLAACSKPAATGGSQTAAAEGKNPLVIEVYDSNANFQGMQPGWYAQVLKEKFNIELNIISGNLSPEAYQTRVSAGELGDIIILPNNDFVDCVKNGLIKDISAEFATTDYLSKLNDAIPTWNKTIFPDANGAIYAILGQMSNTTPNSISNKQAFIETLLRWDYYKELGAPDIADLDSLTDVLKQMQEKHPTNASGDRVYAVSLWPDWDNGDNIGIETGRRLMNWYTDTIKGSLVLKADNRFAPVTDKGTSYYKILKWFNTLNQKGLLNPDSATQNWDAVSTQMTSDRILLQWYIFQLENYNTAQKVIDGTAIEFVPVNDMVYYATADDYYGISEKIGVGAQVEGEKYKRIMEFLDWYASPENMRYTLLGIEGFNYEYNGDDKMVQLNPTADADNLPVPAAYGGGGYRDGKNQLNYRMLHPDMNIDPKTGEPYTIRFWSSYYGDKTPAMITEWEKKFGAADDIDYMLKHQVLKVEPAIIFVLENDTSDMALLRKECYEVFKNYSWQMIYANDDAAFDALWARMTNDMEGSGYGKLYDYDVTKYQPQVDALIAAGMVSK